MKWTIKIPTWELFMFHFKLRFGFKNWWRQLRINPGNVNVLRIGARLHSLSVSSESFWRVGSLIHSAKTNANLMKFNAYIIENSFTSVKGKWRKIFLIGDCEVKTARREHVYYSSISLITMLKVTFTLNLLTRCQAWSNSPVFASKLATSADRDERERLIDAFSGDAGNLKSFLTSNIEQNEFG